MGAVFVVVADVLGEQPSHMTFINRDDMVQQVSTATSLLFAKTPDGFGINDLTAVASTSVLL
jgi:hypothetical protein